MDNIFCRHLLNSLGYISRNGIADSSGNSMFNALRNFQTVFKVTAPFTFRPATCEDSDSSKSLSILVTIYLFYIYSQPSGYEVLSHCGFDVHFPDG